MNELFVYGPVSGPTGYDNCVRGFVKALYRKGVSVQLFPFAHWSRYLVKLDEKTHHLLANMINTNLLDGSSPYLHFCLPEQVKLREGNLNINFTMFEVDRIPKNWVEMGSKTDLIVVPNTFSYQAWVDSGVDPWKLCIVPLGVDEEVFKTEVVPLELRDRETKELLIDKYKNRIISVLEATNRKNLRGLFELYYSLNRDDTCLILKCSSYSFANCVERVVEEVKSGMNLSRKKRTLPIYIYKQILPIYMMDRFLSVGTHYLSMSYGEGWDLPSMEMAALGKILIVPKHSGYTDWTIDSEDCFRIEVERKALAIQGGGLQRLYEGANWCIPSMEDGQVKLKQAIDTGIPKRGIYEKVKNYTWRNSADKFCELVDKFT